MIGHSSKGARTIRLANIAKAYGTVTALQPLDLAIPAGSLVTLLGPSGCGKSTTLRIVAGLEEPDQGHVYLDDEDITDIPCNRRRIGLVFQNYALFPHMTVGENVSFGLRMSHVNSAEIGKRVQEALSLVRLSGLDDRYPSMLSGGQQQRVALARALIMQPAALLLDEPLGALDKNLRESMQFELRRLQNTLDITTILVTHDQEEALTLSDLVVVMNEGQIEQSGTPRDVYDQPRNRFVAEFLGTANIFTCRAKGSEKAVQIEVADGNQAPIVAPVVASPPQGRFLLAVRPERVTLSTDGPPAGYTAMRGTVRGHVFRGDSQVFEVEVPGLATAVYAKAQHNRMASPATIGSAVHLSWPPESGVLLEDRV